MVQEEQQEEEQELGGSWRELFQHDPAALYEYGDRAYEELGEALEYINQIQDPQLQALEAEKFELPTAIINDVMGMGSWKLNGSVHPAIEFLVSRMESMLRELLKDDLNLYPAQLWKADGMHWCDSMDPQRELDGFADGDVPDPEPGEEGYPRLFLENRIYCSRVFRKIHFEVGWRQDGMHIVHIVLYPRYRFDLPILGMDLVAVRGKVTFAIADASPVTRNLALPQHYMQTIYELQARCLTDPTNQRSMPEWGKAIFSPLCVSMTPKDDEELSGFLHYSVALYRAHLMLSNLLQPLEPSRDRQAAARVQELLDAHKRYTDRMLDNKKTLGVLEKAFGEQWAQKYMREIMFDFTPEYDPPYVDGSIFKLYDYFEENPELGSLPSSVLQLQASIEQQRAEEYLDDLLRSPDLGSASSSGRQARGDVGDDEDEEAGPGSLSSVAGITRKRSEWALTKMYETDDRFRASVLELIPGAEAMHLQGTLGAVLVDQLRGTLGDGGGSGDEDGSGEGDGSGNGAQQQGDGGKEGDAG